MGSPDRLDDGPVQYAVLADEPVTVASPRRKARLLAVLFAVAIVACSAGAAYVATIVAGTRIHAAEARTNQRNDRRLAALEADLAQRQAARNRQEAQTAALLDQYRRTVCVLVDGQQGAQYDQVRHDYGCADLSKPAPIGPGPDVSMPTAAPGAPSKSRSPPRPAPAPRFTTGTGTPVRPRPSPSPQPSPTPTGNGFCLPLIGCLRFDLPSRVRLEAGRPLPHLVDGDAATLVHHRRRLPHHLVDA